MAAPGAPPALPGALAAGPAASAGALIGYARVSTKGQNLDAQIRALTDAGCLRVFADKLPGKNAARPELAACLACLRPGDTLVVTRLDRLSRSLQDLIATVAELRRRGAGFRSLHEALDTTTPGGRLVFHVFAALAEFIRELIVEGTHEGLAAARARGTRLGRPPAMTPEKMRQVRAMLTRPEETISSIARLVGVSRATLYKHLPEITAAGLPPGSRPGPPDVAQLLPTSLSGDLAAALREHGSATLDEHYGYSHQPWPMPGLRCQHHVGRSSFNRSVTDGGSRAAPGPPMRGSEQPEF